MEIVYLINEEKGFNKLLDKESITDINKRNEILNSLNMIDISVKIIKETGGYYCTIIDNKTKEIKKESDFNGWHKSLISNCISHFICEDRSLCDLIEIE